MRAACVVMNATEREAPLKSAIVCDSSASRPDEAATGRWAAAVAGSAAGCGSPAEPAEPAAPAGALAGEMARWRPVETKSPIITPRTRLAAKRRRDLSVIGESSPDDSAPFLHLTVPARGRPVGRVDCRRARWTWPVGPYQNDRHEMSQKGFDFGEEPEERAEPARGARSADDKEAPKARSARPAAASSKPEPRRALSVSELTDRIQGVLETEFFDVWVEGEISNLKLASSGHWYFSLKDDKAQIAAVVWRNDARLVRFKPKDGMKVLARGQLRVYPPRG